MDKLTKQAYTEFQTHIGQLIQWPDSGDFCRRILPGASASERRAVEIAIIELRPSIEAQFQKLGRYLNDHFLAIAESLSEHASAIEGLRRQNSSMRRAYEAEMEAIDEEEMH